MNDQNFAALIAHAGRFVEDADGGVSYVGISREKHGGWRENGGG